MAEDKLLSYLQKLFGDAKNDLNQDAIASLAADRCAWRKFVVAGSAAKWMMNEIYEEFICKNRQASFWGWFE